MGSAYTDAVGGGGQDETYVHGYNAEFTEMLTQRSAAREVEFLLPHLRPGMSVLDCGCGPGAITLDLAALVAPGQVLGIDREASQIERARAAAADRGLSNVQFEVGNIYELRFPDASFDAVLAHTVLEHVRDPLAAMKQMRRVLKPGGVAAVRDPDYATWLWSPATPLLEQAFQLFLRVDEQQGGSPYYARDQRRLLRAAGFERTEGFATAQSFGRPEMTRAFAAGFPAQLREPSFLTTVQEHGWADEALLAAMGDAVRQWGEDPDAFLAFIMCAALGWVAADAL